MDQWFEPNDLLVLVRWVITNCLKKIYKKSKNKGIIVMVAEILKFSFAA